MKNRSTGSAAGWLRGPARAWSRLAVLAVAACAALAIGSNAFAAAPSYYPNGPQTNVAQSTLTGGGWTLCWSGTYATSGTSLATIQAQCPGAYLALAGGATGSSTLLVVAAAPRADVLANTGTSNTPHLANGTGWYYSTSWSWGFAKGGDAISRNSCDTQSTNAALRLCWHTGSGNINGGWRVGTATGLNGSSAYTRYVYSSGTLDSTAPTATPVVSPAPNAAGWNTTSVTVTWNWSDNVGGTGLNSAACPASTTVSAVGISTASATCADLAGNVGTASRVVRIDTTAPTAAPVASPAANGAGWNNGNVTVTWNWADAGSGLTLACPATITVSGSGPVTAIGICIDAAGNSTTVSRTF